MSEHREHLLPDTEDVPCRGAAIVDPDAGMRQRIYRRGTINTCAPAGQVWLPPGALAATRTPSLPGSCLRLRDVTRRWGVGAP